MDELNPSVDGEESDLHFYLDLKWIIGIALILILIVGVVAYFYYNKDGNINLFNKTPKEGDVTFGAIDLPEQGVDCFVGIEYSKHSSVSFGKAIAFGDKSCCCSNNMQCYCKK